MVGLIVSHVTCRHVTDVTVARQQKETTEGGGYVWTTFSRNLYVNNVAPFSANLVRLNDNDDRITLHSLKIEIHIKRREKRNSGIFLRIQHT